MRTRYWAFLFSLCLLTLGFGGLSLKSASAQASEALRVIPLSLSGHEEPYSLTYSDDGQYLAVGGLSGIYLFDAQKLSRLEYLDTPSLVRSMRFLPDSHTLAAGLFDNTIKLWSMPDGQLTNTLSGHRGWIRGISVSGDGSLLASVSDDDTLRIWEMPSGKLMRTIDRNTQGIRAVAISPDGQLAAGALKDYSVHVWRVADGSLLYTLTGHTDWVRCLAFSPDGNFLASGSFDANIHLWQMSDGQLARTFKGHASSIQNLSFSPGGELLASSSVDRTVRLWDVNSGEQLHVFRGYTEFIYALSFSPDGKTLATSNENQLWLWDLKALKFDIDATTDLSAAQKEDPSDFADCRKCHHTRGLSEPPLVTHMGCEVCHSDGVYLGWCPAFERDEVAPSYNTGQKPAELPIGLPVNNQEVAVIIASPANGETLYVSHSFTSPVFVTGHVFSDDIDLSNLLVTLDIWSNGQKSASLTAQPTFVGYFKFNLALNPQGGLAYTSSGGDSDCRPCHDDFQAQAALPNGTVRLVVTVTDSAGKQASDERWVRVDSSGMATVPIQVLDNQTNQPLTGLSVKASAVFYEWRARYGSATSDGSGSALLNLEALSQAATRYQISVPPQVVNGVLYASQPTQVDLAPGSISHDTITLLASAQHGQINGELTAADSTPLTGLSIKAVQLPAGPVYETTLSAQSTFKFGPLPVSQYVLAPEASALLQRGLAFPEKSVNLLNSPEAQVVLRLEKGQPLAGEIKDNRKQMVSFAWLQINGRGAAHFINPTSGRYLLPDLPEGTTFVTITAPGYYSQSRHVSGNQGSLEFQLVPQPETKTIPWGDGQITLPPEANVNINGSEIGLSNGWLWGRNDVAQQVTIRIGGAQIQISSGQFAIENIPNQTAWLYLYQGQAQVRFVDGQLPVEVLGGEMIALVASAAPLTFDESVALALHPALSESPVPERIQPTLAAQTADRLEKIGIGAAQTITFITYILSLTALFTIPLFMIFWTKKHQKPTKSQEKN